MRKGAHGGRRKGAGRNPKPLSERTPIKGKIVIRITPESAIQLSCLMLRQVDGVHTPEQMIEYLIRKELNNE